MKKISYALIGFMAGAVVMFSTSVFADNIQTLIGKKVNKEYQVKIDNNVITDKAIAIDGKAYLPVRRISNELGAGVNVEKDVISITTDKAVGDNTSMNGETESSQNDYSKLSKSMLESTLETTKTRLKLDEEERTHIQKRVEDGKKEGATEYVKENEKHLEEYNARIERFNNEIKAIEAELERRK